MLKLRSRRKRYILHPPSSPAPCPDMGPKKAVQVLLWAMQQALLQWLELVAAGGGDPGEAMALHG